MNGNSMVVEKMRTNFDTHRGERTLIQYHIHFEVYEAGFCYPPQNIVKVWLNRMFWNERQIAVVLIHELVHLHGEIFTEREVVYATDKVLEHLYGEDAFSIQSNIYIDGAETRIPQTEMENRLRHEEDE